MTTPLPFLAPLAQAVAPAAMTAAPDVDSGMPGAFNALIQAQVETPGRTAETASAISPGQAGAAVQAGVEDSGAAAATDRPDAPGQAPIVILPTSQPQPAPSEAALTQAIGGEDDSAKAAGAAVAAAIDVGVAPQPSERLVLATSLPVSVRSAASVRVLDQLLDGLAAPKAPATLGDLMGQASAGPMPSAGPAQDVQAGGSLAASVAPFSQAAPATPTSTPGSPSASRTVAIAKASVPPANSVDAAPAVPQPTEATAQASTVSIDRVVLSLSQDDALSSPAQPAPSPSSIANDASGTVRQSDKPAASHGENDARMVELLRRHVGTDGFNGPVRVSLDHPARDGQSANLMPRAPHQSGLVAPATAAALAAQASLAPNGSGQSPLPNNVGVAADATAAGGVTPSVATGAGGFFGGDGAGGFGAGTKSTLLGASAGESSLTGLDAGADGVESFGALLNGQTTAGAARSALGGANAPPTMPPQAVTPEQLAIHVAAAARNGVQNLSVQLMPATLGRIDMQLSVGRDGSVRARVLAERAETLDLLQRHADGLERALESAGLRAETGGLSFGLKDGGDAKGRAWFAEAALSRDQTGSPDDAHAASPAPTPLPAGLDGRALDIRV